jgi:predicted membrane channel-forming protein YqfA (hemolysin III family)
MIREIQTARMAPRLRISGVLIFIGLLIEVLTLTWNDPIAFLVFLGIGGLLMIIGVLFYLFSLVSVPGTE